MPDRFHVKNPDDYSIGEIIISGALIDQRIDELASLIAHEYKHRKLLIVGLLTGAAWFTIDLVTRAFTYGLRDSQLTFMKVESYAFGTIATHDPRIEYDIAINPSGRNVLIVDDIADTGRSLFLVHKIIKNKDAVICDTVVLLDKPSRREVEFKPAYIGFTIPNIWVQGRGLDTDGYGRGDPNIRKGPFKP